jgi:hypothetical protein
MNANVPRTGARNPVLRLRQGYGACALLPVVLSPVTEVSVFHNLFFHFQIQFYKNKIQLLYHLN